MTDEQKPLPVAWMSALTLAFLAATASPRGRATTELRKTAEDGDEPIYTQAAIDAKAAEIEALRKDAARYRWLRERLELRPMMSMAGHELACIDARIGQACLQSPTRRAKGYTDPARFDAECEALDAAIDAAMKAQP